MADPHSSEPSAPELEYLTRLEILVDAPVEVGQTHAGLRRMIPIVGGTATGPGLTGTILSGGADFQVLRSETVTDLDARYVIESDTGERVFVTNLAYRTGTPRTWPPWSAASRCPPSVSTSAAHPGSRSPARSCPGWSPRW